MPRFVFYISALFFIIEVLKSVKLRRCLRRLGIFALERLVLQHLDVLADAGNQRDEDADHAFRADIGNVIYEGIDERVLSLGDPVHARPEGEKETGGAGDEDGGDDIFSV